MLSYVSSTRKKSCRDCVKSKRRCDLGYPCCKRCFTKGLNCVYPNASVNEAEEVVVRLTTPDILPLANDEATAVEVGSGGSYQLPRPAPGIDPHLLQSSDSSSPESVQDDSHYDPHQYRSLEVPPIYDQLLGQLHDISHLSEGQIRASIKRLRSFIPQLAYLGSTPFMHAAQYSNWQPSAYQDSCSLSALYLIRTPDTTPILRKSIDAKVSSLVASSSGWTLAEHLAAVQALIIYQIIRLFDADLGLQQLAEKQDKHLLEVWSAHLWKRYFNEKQTFPSCHDSWAFEESLRRTVLLSVFLRGIWNCVRSGGYCDQVHILARLPLTRDFSLWQSDVGEWNRKAEGTMYAKSLMAYLDFTAGWKNGATTDHLTEWEKLLIIACRGKEDPALLNI
ncbi:hypothetical protein CC78DRAFT_3278 [Lojkania enalia]|uniref:Zn(2)-C6 fungal-type domain-containing protein n=1 Tax=Lojkania enalia TaxID=147567 RepID=A0A9P4NCR4_9PLEO|nr:hypothetical protein CC78DRAFT_3278 [Didymosphaeria enalia]